MVKKVLVSLALAGSATVGSAGVAQAVPSFNCAKAPAVIAQLQAQESQINAALTSLTAMAASGKHGAWWLQRSIAFLTRAEVGLAARVMKLQVLCTTTTTGSGNASNGLTLVG